MKFSQGQIAGVSNFLGRPAVHRCRFKCGYEVVDEDGNPLEGIAIKVKDPQGNIVEHKTDADGLVTLEVAPHETYERIDLLGADGDSLAIVESTIQPRDK